MITFLDSGFSQLNDFIDQLNPGRLLILVDENTHEHCLPTLLGNLETTVPFEIIEIEAGEEMKTIETAVQLWEILAEFETDRSSVLINLGGGVITDLGGFVASTYKRGIRFINIPTTLLGMCDASIGGKTGIDHRFIKNLAGTFWLPAHIFVYPEFLKTLPFTELRSGFAEMLKHGLIADKKHWQELTSITQITPEAVIAHIEKSMNIKQRIVDEDYHETHIRKTLNFGHTVGHAIESLFLQLGTPLPHGEAVAAGMICETWISYLEDFISETEANNIITELRRFYPTIPVDSSYFEKLLLLMSHDKKNTGSSIRFALLNETGKAGYHYEVSVENILLALKIYQK